MRSIRLSLLLYFLGLLAIALGTASVLAYQTAERALEAGKAIKDELIRNQSSERCQYEEKALDEGLKREARELFREVQSGIDWTKIGNQRLYALGLLSSNLAPSGYVMFPAWWCASVREGAKIRPNPLYWDVFRLSLSEITLRDEDLLSHGDKQLADYYQIDLPGGTCFRSPSLSSQRFPLDPSPLAPDKVMSTQIDDVTLPSGQQVRRVVQKTLFGRPHFPVNPRPHGPARAAVPPSEGFRVEPWPTLVIQCAYDMSRRDAIREKFRLRGEKELAKLHSETAEALARVRNRLLLIGSLTFLATLAGSVWLVRAGLSPLRRLSTAVGKISPRNFQLPLIAKRLPGELKPIVTGLKEMLDLLRRAFAREKQATADISHELRTPLAVMLTTTELALRKPRSADEYREMLADCRLSAQQMNEIVQRLLTLARLDAGVDQLVRRPFDMAELADQCAAMVRPLAEAQGLTLAVHGDPALPLEADPDKVREVLNNLLHNAIQYNRPNGRIDLSVARDTHQARLEVRDTGIGIAPEARGQIFERFYRADPSRGDGMHAGLGLALVKEYVDLMGGQIDVESVEGQGSTFRVVLPA
jgi:two-component system, OmpR family, heavy metal sensor histidine kinase CusS